MFVVQKLDESADASTEILVSEHNPWVPDRLDSGIHVRICVEDGLCRLEVQAGVPEYISLNGQPVYAAVQLEHGDVLRIGDEQFALIRRSEFTNFPEQSAAATSMEPKTYDRKLDCHGLNRAVTQHIPEDPEWAMDKFLAGAASEMTLIANFKAADMTVPQQETDLFAHAPDEVRHVYSLHAVTDGTAAARAHLYRQLRDADAGLWIIPEDDLESCLQDLKLHIAWLARPSVLELVLREGAPEFCEAIMKPLKAVVLRPQRSSANWAIFTKQDSMAAQHLVGAAVSA